ncbi:hypothetical protein RFI_38671, partial [Reticulomyxa filosa]
TNEEADLIVEHWVRSSAIKRGWIYEFNKIIAKYAKGFKLSKVLKGGSCKIGKLAFSADDRNNEMQNFIAFSPDGRIIEPYTKIQFSSDGKHIAAILHNCDIRFWDVDSGKQIQRLEEKNNDNVFDEKYSPNRQIVALSTTRTVSLWDMKLGKKVKEIDMNDTLRAKLSPDGRFLAYSLYNTITIWDLESKNVLERRYRGYIINFD